MKIIISDEKEHTKLPEIMRAATHLFVKHGIDGTTTKDIAKEAGVAEGTLYRHFKSKDDLAWYLFKSSLEQFTGELMASVYPLQTARERIQQFVLASLAAYDEDPELYSYLILREHSELQKFAQSYLHPGHVVTKIIEDGQRSGEIRAGDPFILGSLFVGAVIRLCVVKMYGNIKSDLRPHAKDVSDMIFKMIQRTKK